MTYLNYTKPSYKARMINLCACLKRKAMIAYNLDTTPYDILLLLRDTESSGIYRRLTHNGSTVAHMCKFLLVKEVYESLGFKFPIDLTYRKLF